MSRGSADVVRCVVPLPEAAFRGTRSPVCQVCRRRETQALLDTPRWLHKAPNVSHDDTRAAMKPGEKSELY